MNSASLKDVCEVFVDGDWIESKDQSDSGIRLIQTGNVGVGAFKDRLDKARWISEETFKKLRCTEILEGDVLVSRLPDPVGRSCLIPSLDHKAITAVDCSILRFDPEKINSKFFVYYSQSSQYANAIEPLISGSTRQRISREKLGTIQIPLLTLEKQLELVDRLDKSFAEMDLLEKNLSVQKSALTEISSGKLDQIFSRKDELDKDIHQVKLSDIARVINGRAYSQPELLKQGPYPVLRVGNFFSNRGWYYSDLELDKDKYCDNGDLLYAWSASFGPRIWDGGKVIYHYHIWKIEEKKELVLRDWLYWWFLWDVKQIKEAHGTGSTMMHVTKGAMENRLVELPSIDVQSQQIREIAELQLATQKLESNYKILEENHSSLRSAVIASALKEAVA